MKVQLSLYVALIVLPINGADYRLSIVSSSGQVIAGHKLDNLCGLAINNAGEIVFIAHLFEKKDTVSRTGIFTPSRHLITTNENIGEVTLQTIGNSGILGTHCFISINDAGTIVFESSYVGKDKATPPSFGIFTTSLQAISKQVSVSAHLLLSYFTFPVINNSGEIAFFAASRGTEHAGIYTPTRSLAMAGDVIDQRRLSANFGYRPSINSDGSVVFSARFLGGEGIFTPSQVVAQTGTTIDGRSLTGVETPAINNGNVVFVGSYSRGNGLFTPSRLLVATGDSTNGKTFITVSSPSINSVGEIVFIGSTSEGDGIFIRSQLIMAAGATIAGRKVIAVSSPAINNKGAIVFSAEFSDGNTGIILAEP